MTDDSNTRLYQRFGKYRKQEVLGRGGWGEVWKAHEEGLGRTVALKLLRGAVEPEDRERFTREAQVAAKLNHPAIVPVYEHGRIDDVDYISMACVEGQPLSKLRLPIREGLTAMRDVARAVHYAHEQGVIHRDLKPANVMIESKTGRAFVLDFGLARQVKGGTSLSLSGAIIGTPMYMSPEQAKGHVHVDARADVYGLGATLYEVVTGQGPFDAPDLFGIVQKVETEEPTSPRRLNPRLDREVEVIILKAMDKDPARRYESAAALADDIDRHLRGDPISARPASMAYRVYKRIRKQPLVYGLYALLLVAAAVGVALILSRAAAARSHALDVDELRALDADMQRARDRVRAAEDLELETAFNRVRWTEFLDEAESLCAKALRRRPDYATAWYETGKAAMARRLWADAIEKFTEALKRDPRYLQAYYDRATARVEQLFDLEAETFLGHEGPAFDAEEKRLIAAAQADLDRLPAGAVKDVESEELALLRIFVARDWEAFDRRISDVYKRREADWRVRRLMAEARHRRRPGTDISGALDVYTDLAQTRRSAAWIWLRVAHLWRDLKNDRRTLEAANRALAIDPDLPFALLWRSEVNNRLGAVDASLADVNRAVELKPDFGLAYALRSEIKFTTLKWDDAVADATRAIGLGVDNVQPRFIRALVRNERRDHAGAYEDYTVFLAQKPDDIQALLGRGMAAKQLERYADAEKDFVECLKLAPEDWDNRGFAEFHLREVRRLRDEY